MKKRFLSWILLLAMAISLVPAQAAAAESTDGIYSGPVIGQVNPEYPEIASQENDSAAQSTFRPITRQEMDNATYGTMAQAVGVMRRGMSARKSTITLYYKTKSADIYGEDGQIRRILKLAMRHTGNPKEGDYLERSWERWNCQPAYSYEDGYYCVALQYSMEYMTTAAQEKEMDGLVNNVLKQINVYKKSDLEKIAAVYKYICDHVTYDYANFEDDTYMLKYTAYAGLKYGTCVCQGYSVLMYRLLLELGVDTRYIRGYGAGGNHGWNIVEADGLYYYCDSTWDAGQYASNYSYFMLGSEEFTMDHTPRSELYETEEFKKEFPISPSNYWDLNIVQDLQNTYVDDGEELRLEVKASGYGKKYEWYGKDEGSTKYVKSSMTGPVYSLFMNSARSGRLVKCKITDTYGNSAWTKTVKIGLKNQPIKILTQPHNVKVADGKTASVTVKASGEGLKYAWYIKNPGSTKYVKSSVTGPTYSVTMNAERSGRWVNCLITDKFGKSVRTDTVSLSMLRKTLKIVTQPHNAKVANGKTASVTVKAVGDGLKYEWYVKNPGSSKYIKSSVTGPTYSVTMSPARSGRWLKCKVTDAYGKSVWAETVSISMRRELKIITQPHHVKVPLGKTASVTVKAVGDGLKYEWYLKDPGSSKYIKSSVTGPTYSVTMTPARDGRWVNCKITDAYGNVVRTKTVALGTPIT